MPSEDQHTVIVTSDNAANITKAMADSDMQHVRCFAHTINLSVQKFVDTVSGQLAAMREIVRFFHRSPGAEALLKVCE